MAFAAYNSELGSLNGLHDDLGWSLKRMIKSVKEVVKHPLKNPLKTLAVVATGGAIAPFYGLKEETRGRIERRVGGVVTGAVTGFLTGGPAGAFVGGTVGGMQAKKGVRGIKGYGKIAVTGAATGFVAGAAAGAAGFGSYGGVGAKALQGVTSFITGTSTAVPAAIPAATTATSGISWGSLITGGTGLIGNVLKSKTGQPQLDMGTGPGSELFAGDRGYQPEPTMPLSSSYNLSAPYNTSASVLPGSAAGIPSSVDEAQAATDISQPAYPGNYTVDAGVIPSNIKPLIIFAGLGILVYGIAKSTTTKSRRRY